jgi:hypothetical protein
VAIGESLRSNRTLTSLCLDSNKLDALSFKKFSESLNANDTLTRFSVKKCNLDKAMLPHLALLLTPSGISQICLAGNFGIFSGDISHFISALSASTTLELLDLGSCGIEDKYVVDIGKALKSNASLTSLSLSYNPVRSLAPIASAMILNSTLKRLVISEQEASSLTIELLCSALKNPDSALIVLTLFQCPLSSGQKETIVESLRQNTVLFSLSLVNTGPFCEMETLLETLQVNKTLCECAISDVEEGVEFIPQVRRLLQANLKWNQTNVLSGLLTFFDSKRGRHVDQNNLHKMIWDYASSWSESVLSQFHPFDNY